MGLAEALRDEKYEVWECPNGNEALPMIRTHSPHLLILDVMLPGKSGFDICREIRALKNPLPILMLTAKGQEVEGAVFADVQASAHE